MAPTDETLDLIREGAIDADRYDHCVASSSGPAWERGMRGSAAHPTVH